MDDVAISYQQLLEINFIHTGLPAGINTSEWIQLDIDTDTTQLLRDNKLLIRPSDTGWRLLTVAQPGNLPWCNIDGIHFSIGFFLSAAAAASQQLPAHFLMPPLPDNTTNLEGRYVFGNIIARDNGSVFPDISIPAKIYADYSVTRRYFGYLEIKISKGSTDFDILDSTGKIRFIKGQPPCKFQITFHK
ncbi:hypothetical protein [Chitinophaga sp. Cy-1792]|uniref:hypothetical protein n=1 Tax=Chitinophaga sp. Cy-1792 TaxID=2608339 RepID=UPI0014228ABA|nr:hypothetical protein [Chitinophaga sp. Cy-1792]NIG53831.1 hypothetical protein [Chitinophaga sp. Cy-1792]